MGKSYSRFEPVELLTSAARLVTGTGGAVALLEGFEECEGAAFILDLTDAQDAVGDTLDVYVQAQLDNTPNWVDVAHFTQILGNGANDLIYVTKVLACGAEAEFEIGSALGAAAVRDLLAQSMRVRWAIADGGGAHSFTFSVSAVPM